MKKLLSILGAVWLMSTTGISTISCGTFLDGRLPWDDGDKNPPDKIIQVIDEESADLIIKLKSDETWTDYSYSYQEAVKTNQENYQEILNDEDYDPNDPDDVLSRRVFMDLFKIYEYWYSIITNFAQFNYILTEKGIEEGFNWDTIANEENLEYLIKLFNSLILTKTNYLSFNWFFLTEYEPNVLNNKDVWHDDQEEQKNQKQNWKRVSDSLNYYSEMTFKFLVDVIKTILIIDPEFNTNQFLFSDYRIEMKKNDYQEIQILNYKDYDDVKLNYETNDDYKIELDQIKESIIITTQIKTNLTELKFSLESVKSKINKEVIIKIN